MEKLKSRRKSEISGGRPAKKNHSYFLLWFCLGEFSSSRYKKGFAILCNIFSRKQKCHYSGDSIKSVVKIKKKSEATTVSRNTKERGCEYIFPNKNLICSDFQITKLLSCNSLNRTPKCKFEFIPVVLKFIELCILCARRGGDLHIFYSQFNVSLLVDVYFELICNRCFRAKFV
jgi:hypothetical protein